MSEFAGAKPRRHRILVGRAYRESGWSAACQDCPWGAWSPLLWYVRLKAWWHR